MPDHRPSVRRLTHVRRPASAGLAAIAIVGLAALTVGSAGCSNRTSDRDIEVLGVSDARIAVAGETTLLGDERRGAWIDPRVASDWLTERIPGARHVPVGAIREQRDELLEFDVLVVYGRGFKDPVAYAAAKVLSEIGVPEVRVLEGGLTAWINSGGDVASGSPVPGEGTG